MTVVDTPTRHPPFHRVDCTLDIQHPTPHSLQIVVDLAGEDLLMADVVVPVIRDWLADYFARRREHAALTTITARLRYARTDLSTAIATTPPTP